ncbi:required for excision 1-B domain-containing protein-like [Acipenser oxyrinchus oxyrinchus]|uniref:Required for excision 1-B domain-containing protein-like n=1 Tax=Acipenser oxyrinchus oxyrinchus TaxID=40147 RepID=A0AAD8FYY4_ACIOX|nr:required for excision 1-B domain-containing protein-like [Acipenser oxyrinchus oxyrinchus]
MIIPNTDSSGKIVQRISDTFGKLQKNDYPAMPAGTGCRSLVQRFYALQAERVEAYRLFEEGHEAYLRTAPHYDFQHYRQLVHEITLAFSGISKELIEMKEHLHEECERPDLSEHIEKLQEKERHKLELTAKLQLAKQNVVDHPEDESGPELVQELRQKIIKTVEAISEILQDFKYDSEELA